MTTRTQAVDEKLGTIVAMLESQHERQEQLLAQTDELAAQQKECQKQLEEMHRLREYVRELGETMEGRMREAERILTAVKTEPKDPHYTIDSDSTGLRATAPEFRPATETPGDETEGGGVVAGGGVMTARTVTETRQDTTDKTAETLTRRAPSQETSTAATAIRDGSDEITVMTATTRRGPGTFTVAAPRTIRPSPYDGRSPWDTYKAQFEMLAELNAWTDNEKGTFLAINLKGPALSVLGNLSPSTRSNYNTLTAALDSRFGVAHQAELNRARLRSRRRGRDEGLPELAEDIERLARLAYPEADSTMLEVLGKDQFIDALVNDDNRLRLRQMRPPTLRVALEHALELESYQLASQQIAVKPVRRLESSSTRRQQYAEQEKEPGCTNGGEELLQECVRLLQQYTIGGAGNSSGGSKQPNRFKKKNKEEVVCWKCKQKGHIQRNCTQRALRGVEMSLQHQGNEQ